MSHRNMTPTEPTNPPVRPTEIKTWLTEESMSPLGRELTRLAREIEESDEPALDEKAIEKELQRRSGGFGDNAD